eukprot:TRINITY_DN29464_c0_g1_i1.p1 TRINITY_DN29464_c0_g1~~TRINITY_DN29464_c0_g1_i1.p1  ORF type:complete len:348 (+),score=65.41 TRINITY_DN29464_c0_g1_i1:92-1045(+)
MAGLVRASLALGRPLARPRLAALSAGARVLMRPQAPLAAVLPSTSGRRLCSGKAGSDDGEFPNSWTAPEALYNFRELDEGLDDEDDVATDLGARNKQWREEKLAEDGEFFTRMGQGQQPKYLWIGCCDSRVAAENMIGAEPGELFMHRNIANMVIGTDTNIRSVLQYAVEYLEVRHIVVCGHYDCGGVKAAANNVDVGSPLESWLSHIRDVYRLHQEELDAIIDEDERHKRLVELNVIEQCLNLFKTGTVQRRRCFTAQRPHKYPSALPRIHGMVFSPADGILRKLPVDFKDYMKKYSSVYNLYDPDNYLHSTADPI